MCGIVGIVGTTEVAAALYDGLTVLQHRGQDAAGIATVDGTQLRVHKGNGLVRDVFDAKAMALLEGRVGIGHCRYPTAGSEGSDEAQPFYVNSPYGIALAHNGNLINTDALRREVFEQDRRNINTESDSEVLLNVFAHELDRAERADAGSRVPGRSKASIAAPRAAMRWSRRCSGLGLVAFRDPHGIRPLVLGKRTTAGGTTNTWSPPNRSRSTSSASSACATWRRARASSSPRAANCIARQCAEPQQHAPCIFEYVYFARPDSMIEEISVHKARMRMGVTLGEKILRQRPDHDIDVVIPIPDTSRDAALEIANVLGVKYREGFIKNRYVGRTFIMPGQGERAKSVQAQAQPDPAGIQEPRGAAGRRFDRARHHLASRSCRWRATPARARSTSPRPRRRCAIRTSTASTCRRSTNWSRTAAARRRSNSSSAATG